MISLRDFKEEDTAAVKENKFFDKTEEEIAKIISEWNIIGYEGKYFEMFAIENDGKVVGSISLYEKSKSVASIGIEVFEKEQRKGYAAEAMSLLEKYASEKGFKVIQSQISADNEASRKLGEKLGYENDGYIYKNRKGHDVVLYLKPL